jgi:hypothetical protein
MSMAIAAVAGLVALVAVSYVVEALRPQPAAPERLDWAQDIAVRYATLNGTKVRYIATGHGPAVVLLKQRPRMGAVAFKSRRPD